MPFAAEHVTLTEQEHTRLKYADVLAQLDTRRKRQHCMRLELAQPFEHEGRLAALLARQRELLRQLDLDKDEADSATAGGEEALQAA